MQGCVQLCPQRSLQCDWHPELCLLPVKQVQMQQHKIRGFSQGQKHSRLPLGHLHSSVVPCLANTLLAPGFLESPAGPGERWPNMPSWHVRSQAVKQEVNIW